MTIFYHKTKNGQVSYKKLYPDYDNGVVVSEYAIIGGKVKTTTDKFTINKKYPTKELAAKKIIDSKVNELEQEGYHTDLEFVKAHKHNSFKDGTPMPMLLQKVDKPTELLQSKVLNKGIKKHPYFGQPKMDGYCALASKESNRIEDTCVILRSRYGNTFVLDYIQDELNYLFNQLPNVNNQMFFHGELYSHGEFLGDIGSAIRMQQKGLKYVIYDFGIEGLTFRQRFKLLQELFENCPVNLKHIELADTQLCHTVEEVQELHTRHLQLGYEGSVIKNPDALYEFSFRSAEFLKVKPRQTDEFKCVGCYSRKLENEVTLRFETHDGSGEFSARLKASTQERELVKIEFEDKWKDQWVTVEYRLIGANGKPIEAVAIGLRTVEREQIEYGSELVQEAVEV